MPLDATGASAGLKCAYFGANSMPHGGPSLTVPIINRYHIAEGVSTGAPSPFPTPRDGVPDMRLGLGYNVFNNIWNTNYVCGATALHLEPVLINVWWRCACAAVAVHENLHHASRTPLHFNQSLIVSIIARPSLSLSVHRRRHQGCGIPLTKPTRTSRLDFHCGFMIDFKCRGGPYWVRP
jgi:hypothetical protein